MLTSEYKRHPPLTNNLTQVQKACCVCQSGRQTVLKESSHLTIPASFQFSTGVHGLEHEMTKMTWSSAQDRKIPIHRVRLWDWRLSAMNPVWPSPFLHTECLTLSTRTSDTLKDPAFKLNKALLTVAPTQLSANKHNKYRRISRGSSKHLCSSRVGTQNDTRRERKHVHRK
ncbi:hypothetical protein P153DRAFT_386988 [Dothidotthia symphoricarpi CBS 119687]|uniref:Uncharacterized protein n=1 Tax=Dothidotthia symphoricarpi CBS 119687 TaxID=1392245 RepID=A0A6A6AA28_9PLEO|nr:uncharacterized protein P153DRAFT_386988 [Dothidotthia symphoricarpi CBS 119687]KAF2128015.1 hypothetical protein P153DRAFT_386988 [Dothidotthia symphoricarpi CBS 119687]